MVPNPGFDATEIANLREEAKKAGRNFVLNPTEQSNEDFAYFYFIGQYQGQECIFDAVVYTLKMAHSSLLYEMAEEEAKKQFPDYKHWEFETDENGHLIIPEDLDPEVEQFKLEVMQQLEEEGDVQVQEQILLDEEFDYGVGLEASLNVDEITEEVISKFIDQYNSGTLKLDPTLYSFEHEHEDDDELDEDELPGHKLN